LYFQVNPTNVGKRSEDVTLEDGSNLITRVQPSLTIFP
jgi:NADH/NAD ratio-sensing transcriptional regulator Rex